MALAYLYSTIIISIFKCSIHQWYMKAMMVCQLLLLLLLLSSALTRTYQPTDMLLLTSQPQSQPHSDGLGMSLWFVFKSRSKWLSMFLSFQEGFGCWDLTSGEFVPRKHFWRVTVGNSQVIIRKCWLYSTGLPDLVDVSSRLPWDSKSVYFEGHK